MVHGDDFVTVGSSHDLQWLKESLEAKYDLKTQVLGPGPNDCSEVRVLNRILRWTSEGVEYEADPRHAEIVLQDMKAKGRRPVATPGMTGKKDATDEEDQEMSDQQATCYRAVTARCNFLSQDRADLQHSTKEASRTMSRPRVKDWARLERISQYLMRRPRVVQVFRHQEEPTYITGYSDSDWAGCVETRKSTSAGVLMHGAHVLKTWSQNQGVVALSSAEAELYAAVKCASNVQGMISTLKDFGSTKDGIVRIDSTAAIGIINRRGLGKVRHIHVQHLWLQEKTQKDGLVVEKVDGKQNVADLMTKAVNEETLVKHMTTMDMHFRTGRSAIAPKVATGVAAPMAACGP